METVRRFELKYLVSRAEAAALKRALSAVLATDPYAVKNGEYHVSSLYFDDPDNTALQDNLAGNPVRTKYRIRMYNHDPSYLRLERKHNRCGHTQKTGAVLSRADCERLIAGDCAFLPAREEPVFRAFYAAFRTRMLRPVSVVQYDRAAFVDPALGIRISVDTGIRASGFWSAFFDPALSGAPVTDRGDCVLEIKYESVFPTHLRQLVSAAAPRRVALSKYAVGRRTM